MVRYFILIMFSTGMRNAEARNPRWQDIYYDASRRRVIFSVSGKGKRRTFEARGVFKDIWTTLEGLVEQQILTITYSQLTMESSHALYMCEALLTCSKDQAWL